MMQDIFRRIRAFRRQNDGVVTVEFVILFPLMLIFAFASIDLAMVTYQHSLFERAVDETVRELRLSTAKPQTHDEMRDRICTLAGFIDDCPGSVALQLVPVDPFNWTDIPEATTCTDTDEAILPRATFENGQSNELMFVSACLRTKPLFPHLYLGRDLVGDSGDGRYSLFSTSAFVQEPS